MGNNFLFNEDRGLQVGINLLEFEFFVLEFVLVIEARVNALLDTASASVNIFIDDNGRILEFALTFFDETLSPVINYYTSSHVGHNLTFVK